MSDLEPVYGRRVCEREGCAEDNGHEGSCVDAYGFMMPAPDPIPWTAQTGSADPNG